MSAETLKDTHEVSVRCFRPGNTTARGTNSGNGTTRLVANLRASITCKKTGIGMFPNLNGVLSMVKMGNQEESLIVDFDNSQRGRGDDNKLYPRSPITPELHAVLYAETINSYKKGYTEFTRSYDRIEEMAGVKEGTLAKAAAECIKRAKEESNKTITETVASPASVDDIKFEDLENNQ